jgi:HEAT repeat protein
MRKAVVWPIVLGAAAGMGEPLRAQTPAPTSTSAHESAAQENTASHRLDEGGAGLAELFGSARTERLLRSADLEDRLHGLERAAAAHTPEALALLLRFRDDAGGNGGDPRTLLTLVRGFADWLDVPAVRAKLVGIARDPGTFLSIRGKTVDEDPVDDERVRVARIDLARAEADIALASSKNSEAIKSLFEIVRDSDAGRGAAAEALAAFPPDAPSGPWNGPSIATIGVLASLGDLRSDGNLLTAIGSSDAGVRAASLITLAGFGDPHASDAARAWRRDPDARVRLAAAATLVRAGDPDGAHAVEDLIADEETAEDGLLLAQRVQGEGVAKAAIARAVASANPILRRAAVSALARQTAGSAVEVLLTLAGDPILAAPAADGLARSPSESALAAIETLGARAASERLAARAYFVRRYTRGDRSSRLEALLDRLSRSSDGADRAVALEARVGLGDKPVQGAWSDSDARVRRAAALGAIGRLDSNTAAILLRRLTIETDEVTRVILAGALATGDAGVAPSSARLRARVAAGQPDAPLAAFVLGERDDGTSGEASEALYASRDPFIRAAALRGLGASKAPDSTARLASAYRWEPDGHARRAIIEALATRAQDRALEVWRRTLDWAVRLDPDAATRGAAQRALSDRDLPRPAAVPEVAWIVLAPAESADLPSDVTGLLVDNGGLGFPLAFDDDGFALLPGVRAGEAQVRLAAQLPAYSPGGP